MSGAGNEDGRRAEMEDENDFNTPTDRFLLDAMLGTLTTYLRMCGYDAAYALDHEIEADD